MELRLGCGLRGFRCVELRGQVLEINYVGEKRLKKASLKELLLVATLENVAAHFQAAQVKFHKEFGNACVEFLKQEDAAEAFNLKEIEMDGCKLHLKLEDFASNSSSKNMRDNPAKQVKFSKKLKKRFAFHLHTS
ncbi:hypothetical protein TNIN_141791 [Trichonephila inaurata madagascariensis]|uniref:Uncharacterized protein n=1 Tax=Trichonephila inaurata madagascariensis TaxID=2747483 RepID=A0A8X6YVC3_9ARAC|nr:hypothetical protein TNIN_141791 [Trichonephila inaurata madagascariensis]